MANKETKEVWAGPGVLSMGRRKIAVGDEIPAELGKEARASLRDKKMIVDKVVEPEDEPADLEEAALDAADAADEAEKELAAAKEKAPELAKAVEEARKAVSTAKGLNTKAQNALKAEETDDTKAAVAETEQNLTDAETALTEAQDKLNALDALAEKAVRLRMEADKAKHALG